MLDTTQYSMALYFYMYGAFDTSLLKHFYCMPFVDPQLINKVFLFIFLSCVYKGKCCHTISQQNNIGLNASFQEFMHVYTVPMHSRTPYPHLSGK